MVTAPSDVVELEMLERLSRDLKDAARTLTAYEARYLVDVYYQMQDQRIRAAGQVRASATPDGETGVVEEPHSLTLWAQGLFATAEKDIRRALQAYSESSEPGRWALSITGIGPVISAGLLAHIDITKAPTVGHIWRFAGLDPTVKWEKGQKRPWNARLKVICWRAGESFVKVQNNDNDVYGKVYAARKRLEEQRNADGMFKEQAEAALEAKKWRDGTVSRARYEAGELPQARIHLRATRYAVKLFLSHLHHVMYESHFGTPPPKPYVLSHLDHAHFEAPPNWPMA